jgi:hypothetical protein
MSASKRICPEHILFNQEMFTAYPLQLGSISSLDLAYPLQRGYVHCISFATGEHILS